MAERSRWPQLLLGSCKMSMLWRGLGVSGPRKTPSDLEEDLTPLATLHRGRAQSKVMLGEPAEGRRGRAKR